MLWNGGLTHGLMFFFTLQFMMDIATDRRMDTGFWLDYLIRPERSGKLVSSSGVFLISLISFSCGLL